MAAIKKTKAKRTYKKPEDIKVYCRRCSGNTNHRIVKNVNDSIFISEWDYHQHDSWQVVQCKGCETFSFRFVTVNSEDMNPETGEYSSTIDIFPKTGEHFLQTRNYYNAPPIVRTIYKETINAYNSDLRILCAAGLRSIIDCICNAENIKSGKVQKINNKTDEPIFDESNNPVMRISKDLEGKINGLAENGLLTATQASVLHQHRYLGNEAVHRGNRLKMEDLKIAIEIIHHVLDSIYEIQISARSLERPKPDKRKNNKQSS